MLDHVFVRDSARVYVWGRTCLETQTKALKAAVEGNEQADSSKDISQKDRSCRQTEREQKKNQHSWWAGMPNVHQNCALEDSLATNHVMKQHCS